MRQYCQLLLLFLISRVVATHDGKRWHYLIKVPRSLHVSIVVCEFGWASPNCFKHVVVVWTELLCVSHHVLVVSELDRLCWQLRCLRISPWDFILLLCGCLMLLRLLNLLLLLLAHLFMTAETYRFLQVACSVVLDLLQMDNLVAFVVHWLPWLVASIGRHRRLCVFIHCPENIILIVVTATVVSLPY